MQKSNDEKRKAALADLIKLALAPSALEDATGELDYVVGEDVVIQAALRYVHHEDRVLGGGYIAEDEVVEEIISRGLKAGYTIDQLGTGKHALPSMTCLMKAQNGLNYALELLIYL